MQNSVNGCFARGGGGGWGFLLWLLVCKGQGEGFIESSLRMGWKFPQVTSSTRLHRLWTNGRERRLVGGREESSHVRLVGTHDPCQGRVEVWHKGVWGSVCDDDWDLRDAQVLCQSLNCKDAILATRRASFGPGHGPVHLDNVRCSGDETNLLVCPHNGWGIHNCGHHEDAGAICSDPRSFTPFQLVHRGLCLHKRRWTTVDWCGLPAPSLLPCLSVSLSLSLSLSVCVCLSLSLAHCGPGRGSFLVDNVDCTGNERRLTHCRHTGWGCP
uniref:SRCR domain-containing protein n=1 Tax=Eptatretus burgeri TaxID=7764 RepID=A0A8C4QQV7_EPTBU